MALTPSTMLPLGTKAPEFTLTDTNRKKVSLADFKDAPAVVIIFMCNHCPYVRHVADGLADLAWDYQQQNVAFIGINSNDPHLYPDDAPDKMVEEVKKHGYSFPYLFDDKQDIAKAYRAACTPDFYVFDGERKLAYRGQLDDSRPENGIPVTGRDLRAALDALLSGEQVNANQKPSIGCNIKWRPGHEPEYAHAK